MPIGLLLVYCLLEHGFEDLVHNLNMVIFLSIIGGSILMFKLQQTRDILPYGILKCLVVVKYELARDIETSNDVVKENLHCDLML